MADLTPPQREVLLAVAECPAGTACSVRHCAGETGLTMEQARAALVRLRALGLVAHCPGPQERPAATHTGSFTLTPTGQAAAR